MFDCPYCEHSLHYEFPRGCRYVHVRPPRSRDHCPPKVIFFPGLPLCLCSLALSFLRTNMNTDQEQEIVRIGKTLEKITHNDLSVAKACARVCLYGWALIRIHPFSCRMKMMSLTFSKLFRGVSCLWKFSK